MQKGLLLLIFLVPYVLHSALADENDLLIKARNFVEAQDFSQGEELLKRGEGGALELWKKDFFLYDRGYSLLLGEKYKEALPLIHKARERAKKPPFPPLSSKADYAKLYALFSMMKKAFSIREKNPKNVRVLREGVRLERDFEKSFKSYEKTFCALNKIKGATECELPFYIKKIERLSYQLKALIASNYYSMRRQFFTPTEALLQFFIGQEKLIKALESLESVSYDLYFNAYLNKLSNEINTLFPLIERFSGVFLDNGLDLGEKIRKDFLQFIDLLRDREIQKGLEIAREIQKTIKTFLQALSLKQEGTTALYDLIEAFQEASLEGNFFPNTLKLLLFKLEETFKIPEVQENIPKDVIRFSKDSLIQAVHAMEQGNVELAKSAFLFADFGISYALLFMVDFEKVTSRILLRIFISLMDTVIMQDGLSQDLEEKEVSLWKKRALWTVKKLLSKMILFDQRAFREEVKEFRAMVKRTKEGASCVASPWEVVLPYFDKGREALALSRDKIESKDFKIENILSLHSVVLENWLLALDAMDHPSPPTTCPGGGGGGSEEGEEKTSTGGEGIDQVLRNIVKMGKDDKEFELIKGVKEKETLKPW